MRLLAVTALIAGALIRIAILSISVPAVDNPWRAWSFQAATRGPWNLYGPRGHTVRFGNLDEPVVYPPLALDELAIVGRAHMALHGGRFENDVALTRTIKGAIVLLDALLSMLLFLAVRRTAGAARAWWAAMAYWLNPAVLMITTLGFFDVFLAIPAVAAVIAGSYGRPWLTGALFAAAVLTKPQGLFVAPVAALALWNSGAAGGGSRLREAIVAAALTGAIVAAPVVAVGRTYDMLRSVAVLAGHDALSALAFNAWWIVSYLVAAADAGSSGLRAALEARPGIVTHAQAIARGFPHPRLIAIVGLGWPVVWTLKKAWRARDLGLQAALAGFMVVTYFTLSVQVHENHFFLAIPLLALAAALRPSFAPVFTALSLSFALNLYLVYGVRGDGPAEWTTTIGGIDATVPLAVAACALFGWFAATLAAASPSTSRVIPASGTTTRTAGPP